MNEDYLKLLLLTIISTLIMLLNKALFSKGQEKDRDDIIKRLREISNQLVEL